LVHLADDASKFGPLDNVSCFPFENYLQSLKKFIRKPAFPLQQVIGRLRESTLYSCDSDETEAGSVSMSYAKCQNDGNLLPDCLRYVDVLQLCKINGKCGTLSVSAGDNCVMIDDSVCIIRNIVIWQSDSYIVYERFTSHQSFFDYPLPSVKIGIYFVSALSGTLELLKVKDVTSKYVLLPYKSNFVALTLLHRPTGCRDKL